MDIKIIIIIGVGILGTFFFILGRGGKTSGGIKRRSDKNRSDLRQLSESDRNRNEEAGRDLEAKRDNLESDRVQLERERDLNKQGRSSTKKVGGIIGNARESIGRVLDNPSGDE